MDMVYAAVVLSIDCDMYILSSYIVVPAPGLSFLLLKSMISYSSLNLLFSFGQSSLQGFPMM